MGYNALVCQINTRELPEANNLQIGIVGNYQVLVDKNVKDGELGVFFESDGQLSEEFCKQNDLIRRPSTLEQPANGGMFEPNRRVKSIILLGVRSEGFWCPLSLFAYTDYPLSDLKIGDQFDSLNGHPICNKYFTPATKISRGSNVLQHNNKMFKRHIETGHFKRSLHAIPIGSWVTVTEKLHGTSQRYGRVLKPVPIKRNWFLSCLAWLLKWSTVKQEWGYVLGARNTICPDTKHEQYRHDSVKNIVLQKGEILYGEVVGYKTSGEPIMQPHNASRDKSIYALYGSKVVYHYGQSEKTCKFYVYRITQVNEDGYVLELPWHSVVKRCKQLALRTVPEIGSFVWSDVEQHRGDVLFSAERPYSQLGNYVLREGVVVRHESQYGTGWLKQKSFNFRLLEDRLKDSDIYVDTEEVA